MAKIKEWFIFLLLGVGVLGVFTFGMLYATGTYTYFREDTDRRAAKSKDMAIVMKSQALLPGEETYVYEKFIVPEDVYLTELIPEFEGDPRLLHHGQLLALGMKNIACPQFPLYLFAIGAEMKAMEDVLPGYGIPIKKGTQLLLGVHLANATGTTSSGLLRLKMVTSDGTRKPMEPVVLSIADLCNEEVLEKDVPTEYLIPGGVTRHEAPMEKPFVMPTDAKLLGFGGHLHRYGTELQLLKNGQVISRLAAATNPISNAPPDSVYLEHESFLGTPIELKKGDIIDMRAIYDKPQDLFYPEAMGIGYLLFDFNG